MKTEKLTTRLAIVFVVVAIAASAVAAGLYAPRSIEKLLPNGDAFEISVYDKETETEISSLRQNIGLSGRNERRKIRKTV